MIPFLDLSRQHEAIKGELVAALETVLASSRFVLGPEGQALEDELAARCGARYGVGVGSGTDALRLALTALGVGPGDEVVTPAFSFVASASTIVMTGATPVFVDIEPATLAIDPDALERALTPRTRAVIVVHLYGHPAPIDRVLALARAHGVAVVEDTAQAIGATWDGRPVGGGGDVACLSFYPTKNLGACGDGGMVLTSRDDVAERVRLLRDHGAPRKYMHVQLGYSSRLDELQAALLRVKLSHLPAWTEARRRLARRYSEGLSGLDLALPVERPPARHVYHQFIVKTPKRDALAAALAELGVGTAVHYPTMLPSQPLFSRPGAERDFAHSARASAEVLGLPCFPELTDAEADTVVDRVREALARVA